ncbi:Two-component system sensor histidine kinase [hydrothermal vent metagenome]|uniref:histidine kinase n=1 Tax=hydrothermal vent metagenome TaxID=652676 RepID=A0A3B0SME8_9ZZZZ
MSKLRTLIRGLAAELWGPATDKLSVDRFTERSRDFYVHTRALVHVAGAVTFTVISTLQGWRSGFVLAAMLGALGLHAIFGRRDHDVDVTGLLMMDVTAMGISMVVVGVPTVGAVIAIIMTFLAALLLDRRQAALVSLFILAWATLAYVADVLRIEPTRPASDAVPWIASVTVFGVILVLVVSRSVVDLIGELETLRAQFLGGVVHDLRNPLAGVIGAAVVLQESGTELSDEETAEMVDMIISQAAEANRMVDDLLVSARLAASSLDLNAQIFDVGQLIEETLNVMSTADEASVANFVKPDRIILACGDPMRVRQVIQNLVSNAFRYGDGLVQVTVENREDMVAIQVIDDGPGISPDEEEAVFAPFTRASNGRTHEASVGLGLSVARQLARLMNGDLRYHRSRGRSIFELTISSDVQPTTSDSVGTVRALTAEFGEVWLGDDGVLRVEYQSGAGIEDLEQATAVVNACVRCSDGEKYPLMIVTGGHRPDANARRFYLEAIPTFTDAVALVVSGAPILMGIANLLASRMEGTVPIRAFDNQVEALDWLTDASSEVMAPVGKSPGPCILMEH